ncbi:hypothetical protein F0562_010385 [Nyssa sinensis]|uniref:Uncharacterized protein n=1 Tax=Nyssa sinensis TaxID=561372 RepID=A0A5J5A1W3_9ASTE|nr:hypothetical protein F0562_010385 [Nyssa sinensis]
MYTSPPVVRDSPSRLTWADQANIGEFIPKEALDLEEEYGRFLVNPDFLLCLDDHSHGATSNSHSQVEGSSRGELHARTKRNHVLATMPSPIANDACPLVAVAFQHNMQANSNLRGTVASQANKLVTHRHMVVDALAAQKATVRLTMPSTPPYASYPYRRLTGDPPGPLLVRTLASPTIWLNPP